LLVLGLSLGFVGVYFKERGFALLGNEATANKADALVRIGKFVVLFFLALELLRPVEFAVVL
jgi:hypothetical protein